MPCRAWRAADYMMVRRGWARWILSGKEGTARPMFRDGLEMVKWDLMRMCFSFLFCLVGESAGGRGGYMR